MIPDKQKKDHKMTLLLQRTDYDLCSQFNKLDLKHTQTSENNNFSKSNDETKIKNEFEANIDAVNKIEEKFSNIKLFNENDVSVNSDKLNNTFFKHEFNIVCDNVQTENEFKDEHTRSIEDRNVCGDDDNNSEFEKPDVNYVKEQNIEEKDEENNALDTSLFRSCEVQKEDKEDNVNDYQNDLQGESKKSQMSCKGLCSRGPIYTQKFPQPSFQPYDRGTWTANSINSHSAFFSGGEVLHVEEPVGQNTPVTSYQQWNDIPKYNIIQNSFGETTHHTLPVPLSASIPSVAPIAAVAPIAPVAPVAITYGTPVHPTLACPALSGQTPYSSVSAGNENDAFQDDALIKAILNEYPIIETILQECNNNTETKDTTHQKLNWDDEGVPRTPSTLERSPPASPCESLEQPPPSVSEEKDSGTDSPLHLVDDMSDNSLQSIPDITEKWVQTTQEEQKASVVRRYPILILPKLSVKARFQMILDPERKLQAWAKIQTNNDSFFIKGDADGDTQLMIVVSNDYEGRLELIYAMVERMRKIPNSLNITNNEGFSALYLACKVLNKQPLVAAYIAEALLEQNVNVADLRYESGLTLPEILENEGDTHDAVLKELLALKDSCGKLVFPTKYQNFKETTENHLNLHICL